MTILKSSHTKELIARDVKVLREYATRAILDGCALKPEEEYNHKQVLAELRGKVSGFGVTEKEFIQLILKGLDRSEEPCRCEACQSPKVPQDPASPNADGYDPDGLGG